MSIEMVVRETAIDGYDGLSPVLRREPRPPPRTKNASLPGRGRIPRTRAVRREVGRAPHVVGTTLIRWARQSPPDRGAKRATSGPPVPSQPLCLRPEPHRATVSTFKADALYLLVHRTLKGQIAGVGSSTPFSIARTLS